MMSKSLRVSVLKTSGSTRNKPPTKSERDNQQG